MQYRINLLYSVDSKNEQYSLDFFVREKWFDERLPFDASLWPDSLGALRVPSKWAIWRPDTFFLNAVSCSTSDNLLTLNATGWLNWSRHQTCVFKADFDLVKFPFESAEHTQQTNRRARTAGDAIACGSEICSLAPVWPFLCSSQTFEIKRTSYAYTKTELVVCADTAHTHTRMHMLCTLDPSSSALRAKRRYLMTHFFIPARRHTLSVAEPQYKLR